jgi:type III restriction enzyme
MSAVEASASVSFDRIFDRFKSSIGKLPEHRRSMYEKLRLATAKPQEIEWDLPQSIDWKRNESDPAWPHHLYVEEDGHFRSELGTWEAEVMREEMSRSDFRNWLRNLDRKSWSFEIPYDSGGETRPLFPDLIIFRSGDNGIVVDLLEPHNSSLGDNFEKAVGLARFAERNGHKFGRIELIRKLMSPTGDERFFRLDLNRESVIKQTLLINSNPQLDALFTSMAY